MEFGHRMHGYNSCPTMPSQENGFRKQGADLYEAARQPAE